MSRILQPKILETKQELLEALKTGQLKTSKYNLLSHQEKIYVELVVFGGYTGEQAIRVIDPSIKNPIAMSNRMLANPNVADTLEELSVAKDKKFMAEISSVRDMALAKLKYIMSTSKDEALQATCAKVILDKSEAIMKNTKKEEEHVGQISFNIQVENVYTGAAGQPLQEEPVIIPIDAEEIEIAEAELADIKAEVKAEKKRLKELKGETPQVNPDTGLPYVIAYEGVNNYVDPDIESQYLSSENAKEVPLDEEW